MSDRPSRPTRVLTVLGTRPEAIKLAPVVHALAERSDVVHGLCVTGQHREMLEAVLQVFALRPDHDLAVMRPGQDLNHVAAEVIRGVARVIGEFRPDWVVVQGDTTTAMAGALAAYQARVRVAHVEAGLRTGDLSAPWPEEMNRRLVGTLASQHFPPTARAADNLRREGVDEAAILVTGNTVIDALQYVERYLAANPAVVDGALGQYPWWHAERRLVLVTGHRRESFDGGLDATCRALRRIAERGDVEVVYPVHLNPRVQGVVREILGGHPRVHLIPPMDYLPFVALMRRAFLIVTDSGGIQEEAPSLGKPVLVTRDVTERPEAVEAGTARLVGTREAVIVDAIAELLDDPVAYARMAGGRNPFGDGRAAQRIVATLAPDGAPADASWLAPAGGALDDRAAAVGTGQTHSTP